MTPHTLSPSEARAIAKRAVKKIVQDMADRAGGDVRDMGDEGRDAIARWEQFVASEIDGTAQAALWVDPGGEAGGA